MKLSSEQIGAQEKKRNPDEHLCKGILCKIDHKCCFHPEHSTVNTDNQHVQFHLTGKEQYESPGQIHLLAGFIDRLINWISSGTELFFSQSFYTILL